MFQFANDESSESLAASDDEDEAPVPSAPPSASKKQLLAGEEVTLAMRLLLSAPHLPISSVGTGGRRPAKRSGSAPRSDGGRMRGVQTAHLRPVLHGDVRVVLLPETSERREAAPDGDGCRGPYDASTDVPSGLNLRVQKPSAPRVAIGFELLAPPALCTALCTVPGGGDGGGDGGGGDGGGDDGGGDGGNGDDGG